MIGGVDKVEFCGDLLDIGKVWGLNSCIGYCIIRRNKCCQVFFKIDIMILESKLKKIVYIVVFNCFGEQRLFIKCVDWYMNIGIIVLMVV